MPRNSRTQNVRWLWKTPPPDWKVVQTKITCSPTEGEEIWKGAEWAFPQDDKAKEKSGYFTDRSEGHEHEEACVYTQKIRISIKDHQPNVKLGPDQRRGMWPLWTSYEANLVNMYWNFMATSPACFCSSSIFLPEVWGAWPIVWRWSCVIDCAKQLTNPLL